MQIINYEALIKDVEYRIEHNKCNKEYAQGAMDALEVAKLFIFELSTDWIPTSEMLPEEYDSYLIMWRRKDGECPDRLFYEICEYDPDEDEWERIEQAGEAGAEIVAWMPLPERYEPKEVQ